MDKLNSARRKFLESTKKTIQQNFPIRNIQKNPHQTEKWIETSEIYLIQRKLDKKMQTKYKYEIKQDSI